MMARPRALPDGRAGQALALAMTAVAVAGLWAAAAAPAIGWYRAREARLGRQLRLASHMAALGTDLPALRRDILARKTDAKAGAVLLPGGSDAIAGAGLQSMVQALARQAGTSLDSAAMRPAAQDEGLRRIGMRVSVTAAYPVLVALLRAIGAAHPLLVVTRIEITSPSQIDPRRDMPVQARFTVTGFRAGDKP